MKELRRQRNSQNLDKIRQALKAAQGQLQQEYKRNVELSTMASDLSLRQLDQQAVVSESAQTLAAVQKKSEDYRRESRAKEDNQKYAKALVEVQQETNLTELTMLALKIAQAQEAAAKN